MGAKVLLCCGVATMLSLMMQPAHAQQITAASLVGAWQGGCEESIGFTVGGGNTPVCIPHGALLAYPQITNFGNLSYGYSSTANATLTYGGVHYSLGASSSALFPFTVVGPKGTGLCTLATTVIDNTTYTWYTAFTIQNATGVNGTSYEVLTEEGISSYSYAQTAPPSNNCAFQGRPITCDPKSLTFSYRCISTRAQ